MRPTVSLERSHLYTTFNDMNASKLNPIRRRRHSMPQRRSGVAVVELAVCLPLIVTILLGTIEACRMIHVKQDLAIVAYEGARVGVIPGSNADTVQLQCDMLLEDRGIADYTVDLSANPVDLDRGDRLTVTVRADCGSNSLVGAIFFQKKTLTESMVMRAE